MNSAVDVQGVVEALANAILGFVITRAVPDSGGDAALPLSNADEEGNVLTGELAESREFQKRDRVAARGRAPGHSWLECCH